MSGLIENLTTRISGYADTIATLKADLEHLQSLGWADDGQLHETYLAAVNALEAVMATNVRVLERLHQEIRCQEAEAYMRVTRSTRREI